MNAFGEHTPFALRVLDELLWQSHVQSCIQNGKMTENVNETVLVAVLGSLLGKDGFSQVRGYKTITQSPIGLGNSSLPIRPTSRALHAGCAIMGPVANRPLSPHLPIKKPQFSATFSISHRIFGVALGVAIMLPPILYKFSLQFDV
ncbi:hypothetical protein LUZ61_008978 [Rhynchospora tenuis]|uniref:Uncharacterized protein n=1 Tax=Rhynchospora tenuis TaxID=198213 RepID=A0AAD5ZWI7_9POAL|nr:hypothetical protein LUZ61_008978 [Rhynchospora tenuis]